MKNHAGVLTIWSATFVTKKKENTINFSDSDKDYKFHRAGL